MGKHQLKEWNFKANTSCVLICCVCCLCMYVYSSRTTVNTQDLNPTRLKVHLYVFRNAFTCIEPVTFAYILIHIPE